MWSFIITAIAIWVFAIRVVVALVVQLIRPWLPCRSFATYKETPLYDNIAYAKEISEIAAASGYLVREHVVATQDGYLLVLHKLENIEHSRKHLGPVANGKVVYFHHGLLTNSELFLVGSHKEKNLPYLLVDMGYEVWLGNNRGNKYLRKHLKLSVQDKKYWDYSLDEFALYDIPDTITYITNYYDKALDLHYPGSEPVKLVYVGFSQGCSQLFASLSLRPDLNDKIRLFVGLSPALVPKNLNHAVLKMIVSHTANDNRFLYRIFGSRAILPSVSFWCYLLGPHIYERVVDVSLQVLFGWSGNNISQNQKTVGYPHMFSNSSVKSIIHWFQIIASERFQMYDETCSIGLTGLATLFQQLRITTSRVAPFPIAHHLDVPMVLVYGDLDILVDIEKTTNVIVSHNPRMTPKLLEIIKCETYEHMDTLWADDVYERVFLKVISHIDKLFQD